MNRAVRGRRAACCRRRIDGDEAVDSTEEGDVRAAWQDEQHERRRHVIRAYKRQVDKWRISREVGLSYSATRKIIDRFEAGGLTALVPRTRGRHAGDKRLLKAEQEASIRQTICDTSVRGRLK